MPAQKPGRPHRPPMPGVVGKNTAKIPVVDSWKLDAVVRPFSSVMLGERAGEPPQRIDLDATREQRFLSGKLRYQLVNIFELFQRRPAGVLPAPVRARGEPDRKRLGE